MVTLPDTNAPRGSVTANTPTITPELELLQLVVSTSKLYDVVYKGEPGLLTLTDKVFHWQSYDTSKPNASVKCSWARVEKRQLSPPGAAQPMIKLVLVSGRTAVFECENLPQLLDLVRDVKARMEFAAATRKQADKEGAENGSDNGDKPDDNKNDLQNKKSPKTGAAVAEVHDPEQALPKRNLTASTRGDSSSKILPPTHLTIIEHEDHKHQDDGSSDESTTAAGGCCGIGFWCWLFLIMTAIAAVLMAVVIYLALFHNNNNNNNSDSSSEYAPRPPPDLDCDVAIENQCPPDYGFEKRYGIRAVEYLWTPSFLNLQYVISDYILDTSIDYELYDGVECRGTDEIVSKTDNPWIKVELVDGAPLDGGANLYNEGKGKRQFDINLRILPDADISEAPFFVPNNNINNVFGNDATLRLCVGFVIYYNQIDGYTGNVEVNYIENAMQLFIEMGNSTMIRDVQVQTVTKPLY